MKNLIKRLSWDSHFFGYEVGVFEIYNQEDLDIIAFQNEAKAYKLVYVFSNLELNFLNFSLVDKKVVFHQYIDQIDEIQDIVIESFDIEKHDFNQLKELALESGVHSRFFVDKKFNNNEYCNLYSCWIENSVKKINSFDVILAINKDKMLGFATLNRKNETLSEIGLIAVSKTSRGLGVGKKIINESIIKSKKAGFNEIQVVTQLDNIAAVSLYKSTNFKIKKVTNIYHFWNI